MPSDAELEAAGARIGAIQIDRVDIFDKNDPRENTGLYRLADHLHIRTRDDSIRAQLLFASGEPYVARKLAETERNLRLLPYLRDAHAVPVRYHDGLVDVRVITYDVWTLSPGVSFGRSGGTNTTGIDIQEENFLGWGKSIEIKHQHSVDRSSNILTLADPNVFGSHWTATGVYADSSDGKQRTVQLAHPFYSLDTRWGANLVASNYDRTVSRYNLGQVVDQFADNESAYELSGGLSAGLQNGWTRRWLAGVRYDRNIFLSAPGTATPALLLPPQRILSYPFVGFDVVQDDYRKVADQNQIGRTEDFFFGTEVSGEVGLSNGAYGADRNALMLAGKARKGFDIDGMQQLFLTSSFSSRVEAGRARNLIASGAANYYWRWRPDWLLYAGLSGTATNALDPDQQLLIGGDNGLRGYPLRYESGTSRALFTLEQRVYTDWYPFRLARVGGAVFGDVGRTWGHGSIGNSDPGLLQDVGFGLRLGNTRSGLGNVLHVDFAFPLKNSAGIKNFQFLVQTFQSF